MADPLETAAAVPVVNLVRMIKDRFGYSAEDLAIACGLTVDELNGIELGGETGQSTLHRIAHAVGLTDDAAGLH